LAAFIIAMVLQGFGAVPLYVLGVTYLDDASSHGTASVHIGTATKLLDAINFMSPRLPSRFKKFFKLIYIAP